MHKITIDWDVYNPRRYGRPWIATVESWRFNERPEMEFGELLKAKVGYTTTIYAETGEVVRWGQRDNRPSGKVPNTVSGWSVVKPDGSLRDISEAEARDLFTPDAHPRAVAES